MQTASKWISDIVAKDEKDAFKEKAKRESYDAPQNKWSSS